MYLDKLNQNTIKKFNVTPEEAHRLSSKFTCDKSDWPTPAGDVEREFAVDSIIKTLVELQTCTLGTLAKLSEKSIKWLVKEALDIFKS